MNRSNQQQPKRRSWHHYVFAHRVLRRLAFDDSALIFSLLGSEDQTPFFDEVLTVLDPQIENSGPRDFSASDIRTTRCMIQSRACAILQMPAVRNSCEACFIALVSHLTADELDAALKANETQVGLDYFTFERPVKLEPNYRTVFCEWTAHGAHKNYGDGPHPNLREVVSFLNSRVQVGGILDGDQRLKRDQLL